ncbi:MAG: hypothetical protein JWP81_2685 [Ferruginibacter sp.]|nr:hypothetical protein [Ferruginibacter sp.]
MDLESFGRKDLADLFSKEYCRHFPAMITQNNELLFIYKSYRSNILAKVNSLRARSAVRDTEKGIALTEAGKYLRLMNDHIQQLEHQSEGD